MATITITIPDAALPRVREALCAFADLYGADATNANAKAALVSWVKQRVREYEMDKAAQAAQSALADPPDVT